MRSQLFISIALFFIVASATSCYYYNEAKKVSQIDSSKSSTAVQIQPTIDIVELAKKQFLAYQPKLEDSDAVVGYTKVLTGDFTGDNKKDVVIFYTCELKNGGNINAGEGLMLYEGRNNNAHFLLNYDKAHYSFYCDTIKNGKIYLYKTEYKPDDPYCCPSIKHQMELSFANGTISEKQLN